MVWSQVKSSLGLVHRMWAKELFSFEARMGEYLVPCFCPVRCWAAWGERVGRVQTFPGKAVLSSRDTLWGRGWLAVTPRQPTLAGVGR